MMKLFLTLAVIAIVSANYAAPAKAAPKKAVSKKASYGGKKKAATKKASTKKASYGGKKKKAASKKKASSKKKKASYGGKKKKAVVKRKKASYGGKKKAKSVSKSASKSRSKSRSKSASASKSKSDTPHTVDSDRVARPHVKGYAETKHAMEQLGAALDELAYVFAAKGVKAAPICGLSVPTLGDYVNAPVAPLYTKPKKAVTTKYGGAAKKPAAAKGKYGGAKAAGPKYAVVKYSNRKDLAEALREAAAHIVADDAAVRAKIDEIKYLSMKDKALRAKGKVVAAAKVEAALAKDREAAKKLEVDEREVKENAKAEKKVENGESKAEAEKEAKAEVEKKPHAVTTKYGKALVNTMGRVIYSRPASCTGSCAQFWPAVKEGEVTGDGIGSSGGQATYKGQKLYTFKLDSQAGESSGQDAEGFKIVQP